MNLTRKQKSKLNKAAFRAARKASPAKRKKAPKRARKATHRSARRARTSKTFGYGVSLRRGRPWVKKIAGVSVRGAPSARSSDALRFAFAASPRRATNPRRKSTKRRTSRRTTARRSTRGVKRSARTGRFIRR